MSALVRGPGRSLVPISQVSATAPQPKSAATVPMATMTSPPSPPVPTPAARLDAITTAIAWPRASSSPSTSS